MFVLTFAMWFKQKNFLMVKLIWKTDWKNWAIDSWFLLLLLFVSIKKWAICIKLYKYFLHNFFSLWENSFNYCSVCWFLFEKPSKDAIYKCSVTCLQIHLFCLCFGLVSKILLYCLMQNLTFNIWVVCFIWNLLFQLASSSLELLLDFHQ